MIKEKAPLSGAFLLAFPLRGRWHEVPDEVFFKIMKDLYYKSVLIY